MKVYLNTEGGRSGSISANSYKELIRWHFKLFHEVEKMGIIQSVINTLRNIVFGLYKKKRYVKRI